MATYKIDSLDINDDSAYSIGDGVEFGDPQLRTDIQPFINEHGGEIVEGSDNYDNVEHKIPVYVLGSSLNTLYANLSALQAKIIKKNIEFEFKYDNATNSNYADVLYTKVSGAFSFANWRHFIDNDRILVELILVCKPFWRGSQVTIGPLYYSKSPAIIQPSTVSGDIETPAVLELSTSNFGLVQQASDTGVISTSPSVTLSSTAIAGNLIVIGIGVDKNATSVTPPSGFTLIQSYTSASVSGAMAYKVANGTETTITWSLGTVGAAGCTMWAGEYRGTLSSGVLDVSVENDSGAGAVSTLATGTTAATAQNDEIAIAMMMIDSVSVESYTWDNSFSSVYDDSETGGCGGLFVASKTLTTTGTQTSTCTWTTADQAYACLATFKLNAPAASQKAFGNSLVIGSRSRDKAISESIFNPIKDFQGSTGTGFYNGEFARTACSSAWTNLSGNSDDINAIDMVNANVGFAACDGGLILKTTNGGATITRKSSSATGTAQNLSGIAAPTSNIIFVAGCGGVIKKSTNGGTSWVNQTSNTLAWLRGMHFNSSNLGWVVGDTRVIRKTTNGGASWNTQTSTHTAQQFQSIYFINSNLGCITGIDFGGNAFVTQSTNGGTSWVSKTIPASSRGGLYNVYFNSSNLGWVVGDKLICKTTNGGASWVNREDGMPTNMICKDVQFSSSITGFTAGWNGKIIKTINGSSWTEQTSNISNGLNGLSVINSSVVFIAGDGYSLLKTTDGGDTWTKQVAAWALSNSSNYQDTYRCYARVRTNSTNPDGVQMRASAGWAGGSVVASSAVSLSNTTKQQVVDLGNISIPAVPLSSGVSATPIVKLEAKNGSTKSINFDTDWAALTPMSGQIHLNTTTATSAKPITLDFDAEAVNKSYDNVDWIGDPGIKLNPGTNNNIIALETKTYSTGTDGYNPVNVSISYFPRFLNPVSTT